MESWIQPGVMLYSDCPKPSKIGWVWQYTYKAFTARNKTHSLKQKHSLEVIQTTKRMLKIFLSDYMGWLC